MREILHAFITYSIVPVLTLMPLLSYIVYRSRVHFSKKTLTYFVLGTFIVSFVYVFAFLAFSTKLDDIINRLVIDGYHSKQEFFDYADEKNIEIYTYTSTDKNARLKENIVGYGTWLMLLSSLYLTYRYGTKINRFNNRK